MIISNIKRAAALLAAGLLSAGCSADPGESPEYQALAAELAAAHNELDVAGSAAKELQAELEAVDRAAAEDKLRLERELQAALDEAEALRLRFDDEIRAELQAAYDVEVERACEEASTDPARAIDRFVTYDTQWDHLELSKQQLTDDVAACAGPAREAAQLTREKAAQALGPLGEVVLTAFKTDEAPDDLEDQVQEAVQAVTRNAIIEDRQAGWVESLDRLESGYYCAQFGCTVVSLLDELMTLGVPGMPAAAMAGGSRTVGTGDDEAAPGTWTTYQVDGCYWERLDSRGEIIANNFAMSAPQVQVTISATDYAFNSSDCGRWLQF